MTNFIHKMNRVFVAALLAAFALQAQAQIQLSAPPAGSNTYNITNTADNVTLEANVGTLRIKPTVSDTIRTAWLTSDSVAFRRWITMQSAFATPAAAFANAAAHTRRWVFPSGQDTLSSALYLTQTSHLVGLGRTSNRTSGWWNSGSRLMLSGASTVISDSMGSLIEGLSIVGDSTSKPNTLVEFNRSLKPSTTHGRFGLTNCLLRNFGSGPGVSVVGPDNGSRIINTRISHGSGIGLKVDKTSDSKGINFYARGLRITNTADSPLVHNSVDNSLYLSSGFIGSLTTQKAAFSQTGTKGTCFSLGLVGNDFEPEADGGTTTDSRALSLDNNEALYAIGNRFGAADIGVIAAGATRGATFIANNFVSTTKTLQIDAAFSAVFINNRNFDPRNIVDNSTYRYIDIYSGPDHGTHIDGQNDADANTIGLALQRYAGQHVAFFDSSGAGKNRSVFIYGDSSGTPIPDLEFGTTANGYGTITGRERINVKTSATGHIRLLNEVRATASMTVGGTSSPDSAFRVVGSSHTTQWARVDSGVVLARLATDPPNNSQGNTVRLYTVTGTDLRIKNASGTVTSFAAGGEANTASNLTGAGVGLFKTKSGVNLAFKRLKAGSGITVSDNTDSVTVAIKSMPLFWTSDDRTFTASDNFNIHYTDKAITITRVVAYTDAATYTFNLYWRSESSPTAGGTQILTASLVADTNSEATTSFSDATIPANSWINVTSSAVGTTPTEVGISIAYTVD